jgi:hypothetical protein
MSEGGEQKPKRLIIYKTHTINYDHLCLKEESKHKKHSSYTRHTQSTMITYVWLTFWFLFSSIRHRWSVDCVCLIYD